MYDSIRVDETLFSFLEPEKLKEQDLKGLPEWKKKKPSRENDILRFLRLKYSLHMNDVSPFFKQKKIDEIMLHHHMPKE